MANLSKIKRDKMIAFLEQLKEQHSDDESIRAFNEIETQLRDKKYGLVWEEHSEAVDEMLEENIPVFCADPERRLCKDPSLPWNFIIEGDNLQALYLLEKTHRGKVDCIYIDPPYNTGAHDWKYNNDYVDGTDTYRHSKWLSMMKSRLDITRHLLNPDSSMLICTIDEKEYLRLGCLLEEMFPNSTITMATDVTNPRAGVARPGSFTRTHEYVFYVQVGDASVVPETQEVEQKNNPIWFSLMRTGSNSSRADRPNLFYPIWIYPNGKLHSIGYNIPLDMKKEDVIAPDESLIVVWPLRPDGRENTWQLGRDSLQKAFCEGAAKINLHKGKATINYLRNAEKERIKNGEIIVIGKDEQGSLILRHNENSGKTKAPNEVWEKPSHDAGIYGSTLISTIFQGRRFPFPKSLYATEDAIRFCIGKKPNAIVLDYFSGSGTTMHAVNLLNAEDGGHRKCIMVTNNEISEAEEKEFKKKYPHCVNEDDSINRESPEFVSYQEKLGIATYVTWPRTVCSIEGQDINGKPLKGDYLTRDADGNPIPMSRGFNANVKYFKCEWTPCKPEDYLLSNALCLHIREMIELQNAIEIDNVKNVLLLNKEDFQNIIMNPEIYEQIENVWVNQNMILNSDELAMLRAKGFKYIPREFFGQELREAAE